MRTVAAVIALVGGKGFAEGGHTGGGGVVHANEWVAPAWMVNNAAFGPIIGGLEGARKGGAAALPSSGAGGGGSPTVNILMDPADYARAMQEHSEQWFQQMHAQQMRKNT